MLDTRQLQVFLAAAETLNFSRAAERLHMTQPSITQNIQILEAHFGAPLFVRSGRKLELTETGQTLLPLARHLVSVTLRTEEIMSALNAQVHGHLAIACSTTPGKYVLPVLLADFMRLNPKVQAACQVVSRKSALELLEQGQVHFAFSSSAEEFDHNIEFRRFISDSIRLIVPLDHPWAERGQIEIEDLKFARFVMREDTAGTYREVRKELARNGFNIADLQTILTLGNSEAIAIAVQQGVGVGFVSSMVVQNMVVGKVAEVKIRGFTPHQDIYFCRHRLHPVGNTQVAFWEYIMAISPAILAENGHYVPAERV